jgi:excisionase family DNA binding protein
MSDATKPKFDDTRPKRRAYSIEETAEITDLSHSTIYRLIAAGKLTTLKVGARGIVPGPSIDALLDSSK